ncbi:LAGLIDADG-like domain-containing protein [Halorubrum xinjiangense]|uniref:Replication factor C small subunit n=1 Tax=Halorubrum xinjiangense TaxID=261291 RepID=A0A1G7HI86_9EURY|nr:LAGLIDADG-like domain-containing protein [Halorubrum xinjiangense]
MTEADEQPAATATGREIWIEKYRPQTLDDIHGQEEIVERLQSYIAQDDVPHLLFSGPAGIGKCVTGDTPVLTDAGIRLIEDVVGDTDGFDEPEDGLRVATMTDRNGFEHVEPSHVFGKQTEELVEVTTRDGAEFRVTPEHRLRVITHDGFEWVTAGELSDGDRIARPSQLPTPGSTTKRTLRWYDEMNPERTEVTLAAERAEEMALDRTVSLATIHAATDDANTWVDDVEAIEHVRQGRRSRSITPPTDVTPELARFVGLAISEARIEGGRIKFYNTDDGLLDAFESAAHDVFEVETRRGVQKEVPYVEIGSRTLTHYLESVFDAFASAKKGEGIGSSLVTAGDDARAAFLRAMFDAEAHISANGLIELTQRNRDHITLLSYLLSTFGISSRRKKVRKSATNGSGVERTYHALYISGARDLRRFRGAVGFSITHKSERLAEHAEKRSNPNYDTIPTQAVLRDLCRQLDIPITDHVPKSINPESPGRERYCSILDDVVDAATERIEDTQRALERIEALRPELEAVTTVPAQWVESREELAPIEVRKEVSEEVGARSDRLLEYSDGRRTPRAHRTVQILGELDQPVEDTDIDRVEAELNECIDLLGVEYAEVVDGLQIETPDLTNLLRSNDSTLTSLTRLETVAERLKEIAAERLSSETVELLDEASRIANADLRYDEIETVERAETDERVYDLTVPETRNYVAGEVPTVMHNTTAATAIAREIYGEDNWRGNFLELNASDQRGIDVVRDRIKGFARSSFGGDFRIVFLDESDSLTDDAQSALRRTMEQFSDNTRFILSCNYSSKIIDPIQSRCAVFRFSPLSDEAVGGMVREIAAAEGIEVTDAGVDALVYAADGDMRRAINSLQAAATTGGVVDEEAVYAITATARPEEIESMVTDALDGDFARARSTLDTLLTETGMAGGDVIDQLHRSVWEFDLSEREAVRLMERIGEADYRIAEGANEQVQLESLLAALTLDE